MNPYLEQFRKYREVHQPNYGSEDVNTLLDFLWSTHTYLNPLDNERTRQLLGKLDPISHKLSWDESNLLIDTVCELCMEYERQAFLEGIHIGVRLMDELNQDGTPV